MADQTEQRSSREVADLVRALIAAHQEIGASLAEIRRLYAEELIKRDEERKVTAAERQQWKEESKQATEKYDKQIQENLGVRKLPWQVQLLWGLVIVVLILLAVLLGVGIVSAFQGQLQML